MVGEPTASVLQGEHAARYLPECVRTKGWFKLRSGKRGTRAGQDAVLFLSTAVESAGSSRPSGGLTFYLPVVGVERSSCCRQSLHGSMVISCCGVSSSKPGSSIADSARTDELEHCTPAREVTAATSSAHLVPHAHSGIYRLLLLTPSSQTPYRPA
jgi:hypothetical protein